MSSAELDADLYGGRVNHVPVALASPDTTFQTSMAQMTLLVEMSTK